MRNLGGGGGGGVWGIADLTTETETDETAQALRKAQILLEILHSKLRLTRTDYGTI